MECCTRSSNAIANLHLAASVPLVITQLVLSILFYTNNIGTDQFYNLSTTIAFVHTVASLASLVLTCCVCVNDDQSNDRKKYPWLGLAASMAMIMCAYSGTMLGISGDVTDGLQSIEAYALALIISSSVVVIPMGLAFFCCCPDGEKD